MDKELPCSTGDGFPPVVRPGVLGAIEENSVSALDMLLELGKELTVSLHVCHLV